MIRRGQALVLAASAMIFIGLTGCSPDEPNELDKLGTIRMDIGEQPFELWLADGPDERERGLMFVTAKQMEPLADGTRRGMLFVFPRPQRLYFWMKNTIIPLDIAYLDATGKIVATHTMVPFDTNSSNYPSRDPALYAIEVSANVLSELGVEPGDRIEIPESVLKPND